jgi:hypothetical protein
LQQPLARSFKRDFNQLVSLKSFVATFTLLISGLLSLADAQNADHVRRKLIFDDEFDSLFASPYLIDSSKWNRYFPFSQSGLKPVCNCRTDSALHRVVCDTLGRTYFTQWNDLPGSNLEVDTTGSGVMKIIARRQDFTAVTANYLKCGSPECDRPNRCSWNAVTKDSLCVDHDTVQFDYTTAMLHSKQKFKYGYFELKFRIPRLPAGDSSYGLTIDWWMWTREEFSANEIDMFEIRSGDNMFTNNVHYKRGRAMVDQGGKAYIHSEKLDNNWHIAALDWGDDRIDFYLDGIKTRSYPVHPDSMLPMPMIIDLVPNAINFCNKVDPEKTVLPFEVDVDYVRVYAEMQ